MALRLHIREAGPATSIQDLGRGGFVADGLSRGGAADPLALFEAAALLGLSAPGTALEMAGRGGVFAVSAPTRFALTGGQMGAAIDGAPIGWGRSHILLPGQSLTIGGTRQGRFGYLNLPGALQAPLLLGAVSVHFAAGIGAALRPGDPLIYDDDPAPAAAPTVLAPPDRFGGGTVRIMPGPQTMMFNATTRARFAETEFRIGPNANRQGVGLAHDGAPFGALAPAGLASDFMVPGDVQMTGEGRPFVLLSECQTMGGYPRIGTVIAADLPRVAQAAPGEALRFEWISTDEAAALWQNADALMKAARLAVAPARREPGDIDDLLRYQLISGVTRGDDLDRG